MISTHRKFRYIMSTSALALLAGAHGAPAAAQTSGGDATGVASSAGASADQDVVVTARRQALQNATERKRSSDTIIDSIVADDAGKLPDNSITEVLQRVPGVTIVRFAALGDPDRFSVEGSGIQVRGLSQVLATLNGREISGANGGGGISWGEVTPELMSAVDVYKASTADRIEGGIGGAVDLRTRMPFDFKKLTISGTGSGAYGDASKKGSYSGSVLIADTFETGIGRIGFVLDAAYSKLRSADSFIRAEPYYARYIGGQVRYIPGGFDYGQESLTRQRRGLYEAVQWEPASNLRFFHTGFISNYRSNRTETSIFAVPSSTDATLIPTPSSDAVYDANGILIKANKLTPASQANYTQGSIGGSAGAQRQENETRDFSQGFTWNATPTLRVSGALQFITSFAKNKQLNASNQNNQAAFSFDSTGRLPKFGLTPASDLSQRSSYEWTSYAFPGDDNRLHETAANLDLAWDVDAGILRQIQVGGRYANRRERDNQLGTYWAPLGRGWNGAPQRTFADGRPEDGEFDGFSNFFKGDINPAVSFYLPSQSLLGNFDVGTLQRLYGTGVGPVPQDRGGLVRTRLRNKAIYAQAQFKNEDGLRYNGNIGLRVVRVQLESAGVSTINTSNFYYTQADANADLADGVSNNAVAAINTAGPISGKNAYTRFLPSFNINFSLTDQFVVRAAVTRTLSMPDFNSTRATQKIGINTATNALNTTGTSYPGIFNGFNADRGNVLLKPSMSLNLDLSAEYYPSNNLNLHVAAFRKILDDLILYGTTLRPYSQSFTRPDGTTFTATSNIAANEVYNADKKSFVSGFEIGGRVFFNTLPSPFDGLGVEANYTYIDSKSPSALARDIRGQQMTGIPIVGLSKNNYNIQLLYEKNPLSVRLAYSRRSRYLQSTNANGTNPTYNFFDQAGNSTSTSISLPVYAAGYGQLDGGITVTLNKNLKVFVQGTNLTNAVTKTLMGGYPGNTTLIRSWFLADRRYEGGVNFSF